MAGAWRHAVVSRLPRTLGTGGWQFQYASAAKTSVLHALPRLCLQPVQVVGTWQARAGCSPLRATTELGWVCLGGSQRTGNTNALAPGRHCAAAQSLLPLGSAAGAVASNRARRASGDNVALQQALPAAVGLGFWWHAGRLHSYWARKPVPNPSVKRRANGKSPGPGRGALHSPQPGPGASPSAPAYLER